MTDDTGSTSAEPSGTGSAPTSSDPGQADIESALSSAAATLVTLTGSQRHYLAEAIRTAATQPVRRGGLSILVARLEWALERTSQNAEAAEEQVQALITLVSFPPSGTGDAMLQRATGSLDQSLREWIEELSASYGDWVSDLVVAQSPRFRNWAAVATRAWTVDHPEADEKLVELSIRVADGEIITLMVSPPSFVRLVRSLARRVSLLPDDHLATISDEDWASARSALERMLQAGTESKGKERS